MVFDKESSSSVAPQSKKNVKRSYIPKRLLIGNEEYVRIGNGNQLIRDPKIRVRVLASVKVRWSLLTARLRLARKSKYCQFFTRFGKCNKDDGKCLCIHDPSKVVVCTKFLAGSCTNVNCISTHKVIPERMQGCSYFLKGLCSNDNCPYRHVHVNPDSSVCENFLRGYCADGNECQKKHTYTCPAFEATGVSPQASLHHPKTKTEKKPRIEHKVGYFDGGLIGVDDWSSASAAAPSVEKLSTRGKVDIVVYEGQFPDYISLEVAMMKRFKDVMKFRQMHRKIIVSYRYSVSYIYIFVSSHWQPEMNIIDVEV
ncbi:zinc finger CCCH domain-containing protein 7-like [Salvia splendens]|uniref:zinc finger CCCH domain-containing protein 7-like n=1 Tax=Salvia splendens TaxID=180675 RepID=UPI001C27BB02|nr:zinc finger CCCH domain-containing protein 7-like [Salvia splendens]